MGYTAICCDQADEATIEGLGRFTSSSDDADAAIDTHPSAADQQTTED